MEVKSPRAAEYESLGFDPDAAQKAAQVETLVEEAHRSDRIRKLPSRAKFWYKLAAHAECGKQLWAQVTLLKEKVSVLEAIIVNQKQQLQNSAAITAELQEALNAR